MANTNALKEVTEFAVDQASKLLNVSLSKRSIPVGSRNKRKEFDGVSANGDVVVKVLNHSGLTSGGKLPTAKIRNTYADCYFLNLTEAKNKYLVITNREFYDIFANKSDGFLEDIKLLYINLPEKYSRIAQEVSMRASDEMTRVSID